MKDEFAILKRWRCGDEQAGNALFQKYFETLYRFFQNKISGSAEDMVQETLVSCLESYQGYQYKSSFRSYLLGIARYRLYEYYRRNQREGERLEFSSRSAFDLSVSPSTMVAKRDEQRILLEALRHIPLDLQIVLELFYWEDLSAPELAEILEIPINTIYSRVRRAKERLKEQLELLSNSTKQLHSTVTDLEKWAHSLKREIK